MALTAPPVRRQDRAMLSANVCAKHYGETITSQFVESRFLFSTKNKQGE